jgi:L-2-hydroxyglutarate oxidase LhgO
MSEDYSLDEGTMGGSVDVAVVGGGIVGLATAHAVLRMAPSTVLVLLEKEQSLGRHQTGRNSGVIHSGIYYRPGSWKAQLCRQARTSLLDFSMRHDIPVRQLGKVIVAVDESELPHMKRLYERGLANGVRGLREITAGEIRELEPGVTGIAGLQVPETAIIDFSEVARALGMEVQQMGGTVALSSPLLSVRRRRASWVLSSAATDVEARVVVTCTGLQSDRVARLAGASTNYRIIPFEGKYLRLSAHARHLVRGLVYPVPLPGLPFLGVHFTRRMDDEVWVGPNAVLARGREAYGGEWSLRDTASAIAYPGFWKLLRKHWRVALEEERRDRSIRSFLKECRKYLPQLTSEDLLPGPSGIRAQAVGRDGSLIDDFKLLRRSGLVHVANAPSPAATSSLSIGEILASQVLQELA